MPRFVRWLQTDHAAGVPPEFSVEALAPGSVKPEGARAAETPPAAVAAVLAVHARARAAITMRCWGPDGEKVVCVAVAEGLAAFLARDDAGAPVADPCVEVSLVAAEAVTEQILCWVPEASSCRPGHGSAW